MINKPTLLEKSMLSTYLWWSRFQFRRGIQWWHKCRDKNHSVGHHSRLLVTTSEEELWPQLLVSKFKRLMCSMRKFQLPPIFKVCSKNGWACIKQPSTTKLASFRLIEANFTMHLFRMRVILRERSFLIQLNARIRCLHCRHWCERISIRRDCSTEQRRYLFTHIRTASKIIVSITRVSCFSILIRACKQELQRTSMRERFLALFWRLQPRII